MVTSLPALLSTLLYAGIGILVFVLGFFILDMLTPGKLWDEINQKQNLAVAIFAGAVALGLAIIVAASIHG
jgi:putative membrane protein